MARTNNGDILIQIAKTAQFSFELMDITVVDDMGQEHTVYISNGGFDVTYLGNTYQALGQFISVGDIEENGDLQINSVNIAVSGIPENTINLFFNYNYTDRPIRIYRAYFKQTGLFIDAIMIFDGRMDKPVLQNDPNSGTIMAIEARNQWSDYERKNGRHTNNDEQQFWYPGDKGFEYTSQVVQDIKWGG